MISDSAEICLLDPDTSPASHVIPSAVHPPAVSIVDSSSTNQLTKEAIPGLGVLKEGDEFEVQTGHANAFRTSELFPSHTSFLDPSLDLPVSSLRYSRLGRLTDGSR